MAANVSLTGHRHELTEPVHSVLPVYPRSGSVGEGGTGHRAATVTDLFILPVPVPVRRPDDELHRIPDPEQLTAAPRPEGEPGTDTAPGPERWGHRDRAGSGSRTGI